MAFIYARTATSWAAAIQLLNDYASRRRVRPQHLASDRTIPASVERAISQQMNHANLLSTDAEVLKFPVEKLGPEELRGCDADNLALRT